MCGKTERDCSLGSTCQFSLAAATVDVRPCARSAAARILERAVQRHRLPFLPTGALCQRRWSAAGLNLSQPAPRRALAKPLAAMRYVLVSACALEPRNKVGCVSCLASCSRFDNPTVERRPRFYGTLAVARTKYDPTGDTADLERCAEPIVSVLSEVYGNLREMSELTLKGLLLFKARE
jgi:hypothetical protein